MHKARKFGGVALVLTMVALALPARPSLVLAATRADIFTVSVPVDATAASATAARDAARADGQQKAYTALISRLTLARDRGRLPAPTDTILNQVIQGFEVANERRSSVHYLADYTFHFRPDAVEQLLRERGVPFAETASKPVVVLPVLKNPGVRPMLWDDPNPWRDAWSHSPPAQGLVPMKIPLGEVEDVSAIDAATADAGDDASILRACASPRTWTWPGRGQSWEGFVLEELIRRAKLRWPSPSFYFWRTQAGAEADLLIENGRTRLAIEIKSGVSLPTKSLLGIRQCMKDLDLRAGFVIYRGDRTLRVAPGLSAIPWAQLEKGGFPA